MSITFEYKYYPEPEIALQMKQALKVHFNIRYIVIVITFDVTEDEEQGSYLYIDKEEICYCTTDQQPNIACMFDKEQKFIIGDYINYDVLDKACWNVWHNKDN